MDYKIIDRKKGIVKIFITEKEDIIFLEKLISPNDKISARTSRTLKSETGKETITAKIKIVVEKAYIEGNSLKIIGKIIESSAEEIPLNKYHSFMFSVGSEFIIEKYEVSETFYSLLDYYASKTRRNIYTLISIDQDEFAVAELKGNDLKIILTQPLNISKSMTEEEKRKLFSEIIEIVKNCKNKIFLLQPSVEKSFLDYIKMKHPEIYSSSRFFRVYHGGVPGIYEALKGGYLKQVSKELRIANEVTELENIFKELFTGGLVEYGLENIKEMLEIGAVEKIYILENKLNNKEYLDIVELAFKNRVDVMFISPTHEAGQKLEGIGGIIAKLRFKPW